MMKKLIKQYINIALVPFLIDEVINGINRVNKNGVEDDEKHVLMIGIAFFEKKILNKLKLHLMMHQKVRNMLTKVKFGLNI